MSNEDPFYKKLSLCITREGSKYPFRNDYIYKFSTRQFIEEIDDLSVISPTYSYNDIKEMVIDQLVGEFRIALNSVVFGDPAGREYVEHLNQNKDKDE